MAKRRTREELLREFDEWYDSRPRWLEVLTNAGLTWHINQAREQAGVAPEPIEDEDLA